VCDSIFLIVGAGDKAVACIQNESEAACVYCKPAEKEYCPDRDYTGDPDNPTIVRPPPFEVRLAECHGF